MPLESDERIAYMRRAIQFRSGIADCLVFQPDIPQKTHTFALDDSRIGTIGEL